jgi:hypothetical protein
MASEASARLESQPDWGVRGRCNLRADSGARASRGPSEAAKLIANQRQHHPHFDKRKVVADAGVAAHGIFVLG